MSSAQEYYDSLVAQGYAPEQAKAFTQQHFPTFMHESVQESANKIWHHVVLRQDNLAFPSIGEWRNVILHV